MEEKKHNKSKIIGRQIAAWIGIILLAALYAATLLAAVFDSSSTGSLFAACLFATVAVPLLIWIYTWLYQKVRDQKEASHQESANQTESHQP